jgi:hypothetical protein
MKSSRAVTLNGKKVDEIGQNRGEFQGENEIALVTCRECGHEIIPDKSYRTKEGIYVCRNVCLSEYLDQVDLTSTIA